MACMCQASPGDRQVNVKTVLLALAAAAAIIGAAIIAVPSTSEHAHGAMQFTTRIGN